MCLLLQITSVLMHLSVSQCDLQEQEKHLQQNTDKIRCDLDKALAQRDALIREVANLELLLQGVSSNSSEQVRLVQDLCRPHRKCIHRLL